MSRIIDLKGREIIDSRGNPTVEADIFVAGGAWGRAAVPSGASTGAREVIELRDGDVSRFCGKGVRKAVAAVNTEIRDAVLGLDVTDQRALDVKLIELDGTADKRRLGANALLAASLAAAKAAAQLQGKPLYRYLNRDPEKLCLPVPMINILNGGSHANDSTDLQEFMIVPVGAADIYDAVRAGSEIFQVLKTVLKESGYVTTVGDEGGFAPSLRSNEAAIELVLEAVTRAGYTAGKDVYLAIDAACSELYEDGYYHFASEQRKLSAEELITLYEDWVNKYPILSIEDGLTEDDWEGWQALTRRIGDRVQLVGDDLFVTNADEIDKGVRLGVANAVLIKVNQIGTLSESLDAMARADAAGYSCIISHRSGETEDVTIADLAVATGAGQIKTGSLSRSDRVAKYNQLLRINEELGMKSRYAGRDAFRGLPVN